jgi:hypothetical protein
MSFLFKSKKTQPPGGLPPATRNIHTSEGSVGSLPAAGLANGVREGSGVQSPTPSGSVNNSLNSVGGTSSPDPARMRQRAESESQVSYRTLFPQTFSLLFPHFFLPPGASHVARSLSLDDIYCVRLNEVNLRTALPTPIQMPHHTHGLNDV